MIQTNKKATVGKRSFLANIENYSNTAEMIGDLQKRRRTSSAFYDMPHEDLWADWHGVRNYDEALELLHNGYQPVVERMRKELYVSSFRYARSNQRHYSFENSVVGFQPIVPKALLGLPECMINTNIKPVRSKIIDVYYDISCNWMTSSEEMIHNGVVVMECINKLELQGYKINLYTLWSFCDEKSGDILCVKIKDSNLPLDLKRISVPVAHSSFGRVLGFDWYSKFPAGKWRLAYGHALSYTFAGEELQTVTRQLFGPNAVYIASKCISKDGGEEYIERTLQTG